jgi:deazaflavin-dependent oxidoreductase (nitroreductase family)
MASASHFLYLVTRGRRSGQPRKIEIWFVQLEERYYVVAENRERAQWVQNLLAHDMVELSVGTRENEGAGTPRTPAQARTVDPTQEPELTAKVRALMDAKYDWSDGLIVELTPSPARARPT